MLDPFHAALQTHQIQYAEHADVEGELHVLNNWVQRSAQAGWATIRETLNHGLPGTVDEDFETPSMLSTMIRTLPGVGEAFRDANWRFAEAAEAMENAEDALRDIASRKPEGGDTE